MKVTCGFVGNTDNNGINFNELLWEQFLFYGVAILYRHTPRCIPAGKKLFEKGDVWKIVQKDFFVAIWRETPI